MSLLVWLPLNGNLNNYGMSPAKFSMVNDSNGLGIATTGKISQTSYIRNTVNTADYITSDINFTLDGDISMCCWAKITKYSTTNSANGIITQHGHKTGGLGITMRYVNDTDYRMSVNTGLKGDNFPKAEQDRTFHKYYGATNIYNGWHHLCITYQNDTKQLRMYVDGKLETIQGYGNHITVNNNITARPFRLFDWSTDHSSKASYRPTAQLNDVRLYDHCLSPKEVKMISQGLIAHYKLSTGENNNLLINTTNPSSLEGLWSKPSNCSIVYDKLLKQNVFQNSNSTTKELFFYSSRTPQIEAGQKYTFSCDLYANNEVSSIDFYWLSRNSSTSTANYNNITWTRITIPERNKWFHSVWTFTTPADDYNGFIRIDNNEDSTRTADQTAIVKITNLKLEKGDKESFYMPSANDINLSIGDDCSGYNNHATLLGNFKMDNATRGRHDQSAVFSGTEALNCGQKAMVKDAITVSIWAYKDNWATGTNAERFISCTEGGGWNFEDQAEFICHDGAGYHTAVSSTKFNALSSGWHMFTGTYDGLVSKIYIDGVLKGISPANTEKTDISYANNVIWIGAEANATQTSPKGGYFTGRLSDARIYCTALSADDIMNLYSVRTSMNRENELFGFDMIESPTQEKIQLNANGSIQTAEFNESISYASGMDFKVLSDGSVWNRIHWLDVTNDTTFFTKAEVDFCIDKSNRFSKMKFVDNFKSYQLPKEYTKLDYIESTGSQYIDTGYYWTSEIVKVYMDATVVSNSASQSLFGNEEPFSGGRYFSIVPHGSSGSYAYYVGSNAPLIRQIATCTLGTRFNMECSTTSAKLFTVKVNGSVLATGTYSGTVCAYANTTSTHTSKGKIHIFANHNSSTGGAAPIQKIGSMKLYAFKMYDNNILVRDFIPCQRADGVIGLFDIVYQKFYISPEGTAFIAGDISTIQTVDTGTYEFMLTYPQISSTLYNRWTQNSSPNDSAVVGFNPITTTWTTHNSGIRKHGSNTVYNCDSGSTWYAAIGQTAGWTTSGGLTNQIPAANNEPTTETELWVRIDNLNNNNEFKIFNGKFIKLKNIIEI